MSPRSRRRPNTAAPIADGELLGLLGMEWWPKRRPDRDLWMPDAMQFREPEQQASDSESEGYPSEDSFDSFSSSTTPPRSSPLRCSFQPQSSPLRGEDTRARDSASMLYTDMEETLATDYFESQHDSQQPQDTAAAMSPSWPMQDVSSDIGESQEVAAYLQSSPEFPEAQPRDWTYTESDLERIRILNPRPQVTETEAQDEDSDDEDWESPFAGIVLEPDHSNGASVDCDACTARDALLPGEKTVFFFDLPEFARRWFLERESGIVPGSVTESSVVCKYCNQKIELDSGWKWLPRKWLRHPRTGCYPPVPVDDPPTEADEDESLHLAEAQPIDDDDLWIPFIGCDYCRARDEEERGEHHD